MNARSGFSMGLCFWLSMFSGSPAGAADSEAGLQRWEVMVEGVAREAWVWVPAGGKGNAVPVVFGFHGHGGTARGAARSFAVHREWPEAVVVYPQGLNTPGPLTDPEGKRAGWQMRAGQQGDRDLKFYDALRARLEGEFRVDGRRVYATGHSNGGGFVYLLWAERGQTLAAVAPSGCVASGVMGQLRAKPVLHLAGRTDGLVKFDWQERTMAGLRRVNGCEGEGRAWVKGATWYDSRGGTPVLTFVYPGGHAFPAEGPGLIARFFREQPWVGK